MPIFLDHHKLTAPTPPAMIKQIANAIKDMDTDPKTKTRPLYYVENKSDAYCVSVAPDAQAVHAYHAGMGVKLGANDVMQVTTVKEGPQGVQ